MHYSPHIQEKKQERKTVKYIYTYCAKRFAECHRDFFSLVKMKWTLCPNQIHWFQEIELYFIQNGSISNFIVSCNCNDVRMHFFSAFAKGNIGLNQFALDHPIHNTLGRCSTRIEYLRIITDQVVVRKSRILTNILLFVQRILASIPKIAVSISSLRIMRVIAQECALFFFNSVWASGLAWRNLPFHLELQ